MKKSSRELGLHWVFEKNATIPQCFHVSFQPGNKALSIGCEMNETMILSCWRQRGSIVDAHQAERDCRLIIGRVGCGTSGSDYYSHTSKWMCYSSHSWLKLIWLTQSSFCDIIQVHDYFYIVYIAYLKWIAVAKFTQTLQSPILRLCLIRI